MRKTAGPPAELSLVRPPKGGTLGPPAELSLVRPPKDAVGKVVGDCVYVHKTALEQSPVPRDVVEDRAEHLPENFDYQIIKWNRRTGDVSFIKSPDWDKAPEPTVGDSIKVDAEGEAKFRAANPANPQIYHHKHQFVAPDYTGFNLAESRQRSQQWETLQPDKSRIGYKKYWDKEVVPKLEMPPIYKDDEMLIANKTARAHGAVGGKALVPRFVEATSKKNEQILDFGSGPEAAHSQHLRGQGFRHVVAHEFGSNVRPGVHNPQALQMEYDTVFASNVLNVQSSEAMMSRTLDQLAAVVKPDGRLVANLPDSPRKMDIDAATLKKMLSQRFVTVDKVGGTSGAPVLEAKFPRQKYLVEG